MLVGKTVHEMQVGETAQFTKTISESDVYLFAGITGDLNPAHVDAEYAKGTMFKQRIAHGLLTAGLVSAVCANKLPGPGTIYLGQTLKFLAPVYFGDTMTAKAEVLELNTEKNRVKLRTSVSNQHGKMVLDGEATLMPPKGPAKG